MGPKPMKTGALRLGCVPYHLGTFPEEKKAFYCHCGIRLSLKRRALAFSLLPGVRQGRSSLLWFFAKTPRDETARPVADRPSDSKEEDVNSVRPSSSARFVVLLCLFSEEEQATRSAPCISGPFGGHGVSRLFILSRHLAWSSLSSPQSRKALVLVSFSYASVLTSSSFSWL